MARIFAIFISGLLLSSVLTHIQGQECLQTNGGSDVFNGSSSSNGTDNLHGVIPWGYQAIIASYRFNCTGNITQWKVGMSLSDVLEQESYVLELQVWRQVQTMTGAPQCYTMIGSNRFNVTSVTQVITLTPLEQIEFLPGDVLGFRLGNFSQSVRGIREKREESNRERRQERSDSRQEDSETDDNDDYRENENNFNGTRENEDDSDDFRGNENNFNITRDDSDGIRENGDNSNGNREEEGEDDNDSSEEGGDDSDLNEGRDDDNDDDGNNRDSDNDSDGGDNSNGDEESDDDSDADEESDDDSDTDEESDDETKSSDSSVRPGVLIATSNKPDGAVSRENVWYAPISDKLSENADCPVSTGYNGDLHTLTTAAPFITVSALKVDRNTITLSKNDVTPPPVNVVKMFGGSQATSVAASTASAVLIVVVIILAAVFIICLLKRRAKTKNLAKNTGISDRYQLHEVRQPGAFDSTQNGSVQLQEVRQTGAFDSTQNGSVSQAFKASLTQAVPITVRSQQIKNNKLELSAARHSKVYKRDGTQAREDLEKDSIYMKINEAYGKMASIDEINEYDYPSVPDYTYDYPF